MSSLTSSEYGHTELICCILKKDEDGAMTLIENDTNVNETDIHGFSPLMYAIRQRLFHVTKRLIAKGCDVNIQNKAKQTALHLVVKGYYRKPKRKDDWIKFLEILLENGADVNLTDNRSFSPLMWAIKHSQSDTVEILIKTGADVNIYNGRGEWCLHIAVKSLPRNIDILQLLVSNGAEVNARDSRGFPPLMWAVKNNTYDMVEMLIKAGADVNVPNSYSDTCLHIAVRSQTPNTEVIECLLSNGADYNAFDGEWKTPFLRAMEGRIDDKAVRTKIATKLMNSGCAIDSLSPPCNAPNIHALNNDLEVTDSCSLLSIMHEIYNALNAIIDSGSLSCIAPIIHALNNGLDELVVSLIEKGCNVNMVDIEKEKKRSVLWFAFKHKSTKIVILLLEHGAEPNHCFLEEFHDLYAFQGLYYIVSANMLTALIKYGLHTDTLPYHDRYPGLLCYILMETKYVFEDITYIFDLLYVSGSCTQKQLLLLLDDPKMVKHFQSVFKKREWIIDKCSQPLTLKEISRIHVLKKRKGIDISTFLKGLPIESETSLHDYLRYSEFPIDDREIPEGYFINNLLQFMLFSNGKLTTNQRKQILSESQLSERPLWEGSLQLTIDML